MDLSLDTLADIGSIVGGLAVAVPILWKIVRLFRRVRITIVPEDRA